MVILAGDVGGTKTNLGLFRQTASGFSLLVAATFANAEFPGLAAVIKEFLRQLPPDLPTAGAISAACFGVAGPVIDNGASTPNLAWKIDGRALAAEVGLPAVRLVNDLFATAEGIPLLQSEELMTLQPGAPAEGRRSAAPSTASSAVPGRMTPAGAAASAAAVALGNQALIAAGTGLGMALLPVIGETRATVPSEGGHADYSPRDEDEVALLLHLRRRFGEHVSVERVVSGPGLRGLYEYLRDSSYAPESPAVRAALEVEDPSAVIARAGLAGGDRLCGRALDMFTAAYGAAAGNLALIGTAVGGVYIGGGIAPKILPKLTGGRFIRAFLDKGRFATYLERIPVRVILNDGTAMLGAASCAAAMLTAAAVPAHR